MIQIVAYLFKYPGAPEGGTTYHDSIHTVFVEGPFGFFRRGDVAIADDRDMDARIALHLANQRPVCLSCVHLTACAPVNGQGLDAAVLQLFGQRGDD